MHIKGMTKLGILFIGGGSQLTVAKLAEQVVELRADVAELKDRMKRLVDAPDGDGHRGRPDF